MNDNVTVKDYIERLLIEIEKRHDERFVNQRDYNKQHNDLQRAMKAQAEEFPTRETVDSLKDRISKLERWPWVLGGLMTLAVALLKWLQ